MHCAEYTQLLQSYVDAELGPAERGAMEVHGRRCFTCTEALEETRTLFRLLDEMERETAPPGVAEAVLGQLAAPRRGQDHVPVGPAPWWKGRAAWGWALVSAAALFLYLGAVLVSPSHWVSRLGTLATWWYAWLGDLAGTVTWLRTSSFHEIEPALQALLRAAGLLLRACAVPLLACWSVTTAMGIWFSQRPLVVNQNLRRP